MIRVWLSLLLLISACLVAVPATAQFGLDDEPVAEVQAAPKPEIASSPIMSNTTAASVEEIPQSPITLRESIDTFREYQAAALNDDPEYTLSILAEPERSEALSVIKTTGLANYVNGDKSIVTWKIRCGACWNDDEGEQCALEDRRYIPSEFNDTYYTSVYLMEKRNGAVFITERDVVFKGRGRKIKKKQKKNNRNCDLDEYDLQIGKKNKTNAARSLLKGLTGVLREIEN